MMTQQSKTISSAVLIVRRNKKRVDQSVAFSQHTNENPKKRENFFLLKTILKLSYERINHELHSLPRHRRDFTTLRISMRREKREI